MPIVSSLTRRDLLGKCIQVIETFDPKRTTVDAYIQDTEILKDKRIGDLEQKFVHQVFYGCVRYRKFLSLFVTSFLYKCPATAMRSDQTLYTVLGYLLFFRLDELGVSEFREILRSGLGTDPALLALLQYALDKGELERWVKMEWVKLYDLTFIEEEVIGKLQNYKEELTPLMDEVEFKATGVLAASEGGADAGKRQLTKQEPFNLTKVRPRLIPEPTTISRQVKAKPVPTTNNKTSLAELEEEKKRRLEEERARVKDKYAAEDAPQLASMVRQDQAEREELARKVEAERMAECTFRPAVNPNYTRPQQEATVRQNAAAVLREDALLRKKQRDEYEILKRYEADLHDASKFSEWQQGQRLKDDMEEEARTRQRMVEMQVAREEAIEAQKACVRRKRIMAEHQNEIAKREFAEVEVERAIELKSKQNLVVDTQDDREKAREAERKAGEMRGQVAEEVRQKKEELFDRKRREDELEMEKRKDLIRQIRALEKVPVDRFKAYDRAEPPCRGLMEEMSLAELHERLHTLEAQKERELADKRERQLQAKMVKQDELAEKAKDIAKVREMAKGDSAQRHAAEKAKIAEIEQRKQAYKEKCVEEAWAKIEQKKKDKRCEELQLKKELQEIATQRQFRSANAEVMEAKAHGEQQSGLEREAQVRQKSLLVDQRKRNFITKTDQDIRMQSREDEAVQFQIMKDAVTERMCRAKAADIELKSDIKRANSAARASQQGAEARGKVEFGHTGNRYMQKLGARNATMSISA